MTTKRWRVVLDTNIFVAAAVYEVNSCPERSEGSRKISEANIPAAIPVVQTKS